jgi:hypothetical protein
MVSVPAAPAFCAAHVAPFLHTFYFAGFSPHYSTVAWFMLCFVARSSAVHSGAVRCSAKHNSVLAVLQQRWRWCVIAAGLVSLLHFVFQFSILHPCSHILVCIFSVVCAVHSADSTEWSIVQRGASLHCAAHCSTEQYSTAQHWCSLYSNSPFCIFVSALWLALSAFLCGAQCLQHCEEHSAARCFTAQRSTA